MPKDSTYYYLRRKITEAEGSGELRLIDTEPTSTSDTGTKGDIYLNDDYVYFCVSTNRWKRGLLSEF